MSSKRHKRYFSEIDDENYKVGTISPQLRKALGLEKDMLPLWIYRMRILGYPPVWLRAAESKTLTVINGTSDEATTTSNPLSSGVEDGEIDDNLKYNKDTLIEYPGFNVPVPKNVQDDWLILGMPPYQQDHSLKVAAEKMQFIEPKPYKRTKFNDDDDNSIDDENNSNNNVINDNVNQDENNKTTESIQNDDDDDDDDDDGIIEIDQKNNENNQNNQDGQNDDDDVVSIETEDKEDQIEDNDDEDQNQNNDQNQNKKMKIITLGTPIPKTIRPSLPSLDKWSIGMGELLHFENLPNSTGTYKEKIKNIIDKVRKRFHK